MAQKILFAIFLMFTIALAAIPAPAQNLRATAFEIKRGDDVNEYFGGKLFVTVAGQARPVAEQANDAWLINDGRRVVYSARDGAGGYENEGQSLRIYDVQSGKTRKIMSEYFMIAGLSEARLKDGRTALLVRMEDGGLGASYFAVVDPERGEVFFRSQAELSQFKGDRVTLLSYRSDDWDAINAARDPADLLNKNAFPARPAKVRPAKTEKLDLNMILRGKVIYNKPTIEMLDAGLKTVKLYLWWVNDEAPNRNFVLGTVHRQVAGKAPLQPTLAELFQGTTKDEGEKGFGSPTFGMKLEGVVLKNGVATVKFSQPAGETNYGTLGPFILREAIEKTALQFPAVKRVEICAVGPTLIDAQLDKQFPRCGKK